mmetsp:Transcript_72186/g.209068  ORF Transcript_72186/g.209068 Transcript_72186/m.209068 type:complete len:474 (-) Transcript_72186:616-2037(-)
MEQVGLAIELPGGNAAERSGATLGRLGDHIARALAAAGRRHLERSGRGTLVVVFRERSGGRGDLHLAICRVLLAAVILLLRRPAALPLGHACLAVEERQECGSRRGAIPLLESRGRRRGPRAAHGVVHTAPRLLHLRPGGCEVRVRSRTVDGDAHHVILTTHLLEHAAPGLLPLTPSLGIAALAFVLRVEVLVLRAADVVVTAAPILLVLGPLRAPVQHVGPAAVGGRRGAAVVVGAATVVLLFCAPTLLPRRDVRLAIEGVRNLWLDGGRHGRGQELALVRASVVVVVAAERLLVGAPSGHPRGDVRRAVELGLLRRLVRAAIVVLGATPVLLGLRPAGSPRLNANLAVERVHVRHHGCRRPFGHQVGLVEVAMRRLELPRRRGVVDVRRRMPRRPGRSQLGLVNVGVALEVPRRRRIVDLGRRRPDVQVRLEGCWKQLPLTEDRRPCVPSMGGVHADERRTRSRGRRRGRR